MKPLILVVDDNLVNLKLVSYLLKAEGYRVLQAEDAEKAIEIIRESPPDLVLLDLGLPKMDGHALLRLLRSDEQTKHLRVCALTAHAMKGHAEKALAEGFDGYLIKPIDTRKFPEQISSILSAVPIRRVTRETLRIAIVEDNENDALFLKEALYSGGFIYPLIHLKDGVEAVEYFKGLEAASPKLPHLILTDLEMPRMNGVDFLCWLREQPHLKDQFVIILTSSDESSAIYKTSHLGAFKFLPKQVSYDNVISILELLLLSLNNDFSSSRPHSPE